MEEKRLLHTRKMWIINSFSLKNKVDIEVCCVHNEHLVVGIGKDKNWVFLGEKLWSQMIDYCNEMLEKNQKGFIQLGTQKAEVSDVIYITNTLDEEIILHKDDWKEIMKVQEKVKNTLIKHAISY